MTTQTLEADRKNLVHLVERLPDGAILQVKKFVEGIYESDDRKVTAVKKFLADVVAIKDEDNVLTDSDWKELADIRPQTNLAREIEV